MTPAKKDSPPQEKTPTAKPEPQAGGGGSGVSADDWREQSEPHPAPPGTGPVQPAGPARAKAAAAPPMGRAFTPPPGFTAGTPVTVTPYEKPGAASIFMVGTVLVGSEEAAAMALKNQLFLPSIPPVGP